MTAKELAFANAIIAGQGPSEAYATAGYTITSNPRTSARGAQRTLNRPEVQAHIQKARDKLTAKALLTRERKREILGDLAENAKLKPLERVAAIKADNEMTGDNAPIKVNHSGMAEVMDAVRKASKGLK